MKILALISQKGGVGKSTLTVSLAALAGEVGPSYVVDRDTQGTTTKWFERRAKREDAPTEPQLLTLGGTTLTAASERLRTKPGLLFIDTRPEVTEPVAEAARIADIVIVPVRPSPPDLEAVPETLRMLKRVDTRALIVINAARNERRAEAARAALSRWGVPVCPTHLADRTVHQDATHAGASVTEFKGASARDAEAELRTVWAWIMEEMSA